MISAEHPVILFDGVCNLCNRAVNFVIRNDRLKKFRFAPFQSGSGRDLLNKYNIPQTSPETFILVFNNKTYERSAAALQVLRILGGGYRFLYGFIIVPAFIRDAVYNVVSRNRYNWFGKRSSCMVPSPETREVFLK